MLREPQGHTALLSSPDTLIPRTPEELGFLPHPEMEFEEHRQWALPLPDAEPPGLVLREGRPTRRRVGGSRALTDAVPGRDLAHVQLVLHYRLRQVDRGEALASLRQVQHRHHRRRLWIPPAAGKWDQDQPVHFIKAR